MAGKPKSLRRGTPYNPKRATAARFRKATPGKRQTAKLERKRAADERRREGILPSPRNKTLGVTRKARLLWGPRLERLTDPEGKYIHSKTLGSALNRPGYEGYGELWAEYVNDHYRDRYNAQQRTKRASRPKKKSEWIHVKAHRRRRPR